MVSTVSLLSARHLGEVVENKLVSLLVVSLAKALNGTPPILCGRQVAQTLRKWLPTAVSCQENFMNIVVEAKRKIVHEVTRSRFRFDGRKD